LGNYRLQLQHLFNAGTSTTREKNHVKGPVIEVSRDFDHLTVLIGQLKLRNRLFLCKL